MPSVYCVVPIEVRPNVKLTGWNMGDSWKSDSGTSLGAFRQAGSAVVGSNVVLPLVVVRIPLGVIPVATVFVVMIRGTTGVVTLVGENGGTNGSCPTMTPV